MAILVASHRFHGPGDVLPLSLGSVACDVLPLCKHSWCKVRNQELLPCLELHTQELRADGLLQGVLTLLFGDDADL